jgi:replicative DNA helicase
MKKQVTMTDHATSYEVTRSLPHALGPEKSVLSTMMKEAEYLARATEDGMSEDDFYLPSHRIVFNALVEMADVGVELTALVQMLLDRDLLDRAGGPAAITDIYTYAPTPSHFYYHCRQLRDKAILRSVINISTESIQQAYDAPEDARQLLDATEAALSAISAGNDIQRPRSTKDAVQWVLTDLENRLKGGTVGLKTGFDELDAKTGGLKPGELFVIAARPSMGKTSLMMNIVESVCMDAGSAVLVFSCEMTTEQLIQRLVYSRAKFNLASLSRGHVVNSGDMQRIQREAVAVAKASLTVDDTPAITANQIRAKARRMKREKNIAFIAVDYLQLLRSNSKQAANSREREIAEISAALKSLAKELGIPIMVLAQLNRDAEKRTGKSQGVPRMSDLRESGSIEQDADLVGLLTRPEYYAENDADKEKLAGLATLNLAKNRNGETGFVSLTWVAELMRFQSGRPANASEPGRREYEDF